MGLNCATNTTRSVTLETHTQESGFAAVRAAGDRGFDPLRLATIKPSAVVDPEDGLPW